jgi:hypothetical protein
MLKPHKSAIRKSREQEAYEGYCEFCHSIDVKSCDYEEWLMYDSRKIVPPLVFRT